MCKENKNNCGAIKIGSLMCDCSLPLSFLLSVITWGSHIVSVQFCALFQFWVFAGLELNDKAKQN